MTREEKLEMIKEILGVYSSFYIQLKRQINNDFYFDIMFEKIVKSTLRFKEHEKAIIDAEIEKLKKSIDNE